MTKKPAKKAAMAAVLAAEKRRQRTLWGALVGAAVLLVGGIVGYGVYASQRTDQVTFPRGVAAGDNTGIAAGSGPVKVDVYLDFLCPSCRNFEEATKQTLDPLVAQNKITLVNHPVAILDDKSDGTGYSTRAAAAAGCAAEGGKFDAFAGALFAQQPEEFRTTPKDAALIDVGRGVGLGDDFAACVREKRFRGWVRHNTEEAGRRGLTGTPYVLVNGKTIPEAKGNVPTPAQIAAAIAAASK